MKLLVILIDLRAKEVHSLKEKRMIVKSITSRLKNTFNLSVREVNNQDLHQRISIGLAKIELNNNDCYSSKEKIINFVEENCDAEIIEIDDEIINY